MHRPMAIKNRSQLSFRKRSHNLLRFSVLAVGLTGLGVVIGKVGEHPFGTHDDPLAPSNQLSATVLPPPIVSLAPSADLAPPVANLAQPGEPNTPEAVPSTSAENPALKTVDVTIEKGSNLSKIFAKLSLPSSELDQIIKLGSDAKSLTRLRAGDSINLELSDEQDGNPQLQRLSYNLGMERTLHIVRTEEGDFKAEVEQHPLEYRQALGHGTIHDSFYNAATEAGIAPDIVMQLADIFGWKINFLTDIQDGDSFSILYESVYKDGEQVTTGDILAASFTNSGKLYQAVRYSDGSGNTAYYTPDGKSLERGFLRYPVEFSRISSGFSHARLHPILNVVREHKGVDFAAPAGTPIRASADGKITFQGWKGGYGKVVMLQHDGVYSTVYGHMSRFEPSLSQGKSVKQGQVIGYVGATGYATGPHLHYEFRVNGVHQDPLSAKLPEATPIAANQRARFLNESAQLMTQLARMENEAKTASIDTDSRNN
ncbi:MAG: peptidoglycan DD-metalloendopeptidase family protein [Halothiobacillaceae bacterium]|nr:peptidoglycan DD-metalloendopeptidase family protein [Halothiobacillaceae bacterium]